MHQVQLPLVDSYRWASGSHPVEPTWIAAHPRSAMHHRLFYWSEFFWLFILCYGGSNHTFILNLGFIALLGVKDTHDIISSDKYGLSVIFQSWARDFYQLRQKLLHDHAAVNVHRNFLSFFTQPKATVKATHTTQETQCNPAHTTQSN